MPKYSNFSDFTKILPNYLNLKYKKVKLGKYLLKFVTQPMFGRFTLKESDVIVNFKFQKPKYLRSVPTSITDFREAKIFYFAKINFIYIVMNLFICPLRKHS